MTKYLITLKPVENYFFGGENTFNSNDSNDVNYFARSNPYPQQTTLLGTLRYLILQSNDALSMQKKTVVAKLVGANSFNVKEKQNEQDFGVIKKLSQLYIYNVKSKQFFRISLSSEDLKLEFIDGQVVLQKKHDFDLQIDGFNPKEYIKPVLKDTDNNELSFDEIFKELNPKIGIDKEGVNQNKDNDEKKMYKQIFYTLKGDYAFAFFADINNEAIKINNEAIKINKEAIVAVGAEQKQFIAKIKHENIPEEPVFKIQNALSNRKKIVLTSDAYVEESIFDYVDFMINQIQDFRTVNIAFADKHFNKKKDISIKINLLKRGSVLYYNDDKEEDILVLLNKNKNYTKIGFNQYIKI